MRPVDELESLGFGLAARALAVGRAVALMGALASLSAGCSSDSNTPAAAGGAASGSSNAGGVGPQGGTGGMGTAGATGGAGTGNGGGGKATAGSSGSGSGAGGSSGAGAGGSAGGINAGGVRWLGRVDARDAAAVKFAWSGSGLVAIVEGSKLSVRLRTEGATDTVFFQPVIDGSPGERFEVPLGEAQTIVLGEGLAAGPHRVELYRESEGAQGVSTFLGFVDGDVVGSPSTPTRLIEIVGDSISAGYGSLGMDVHPPWDQSCPFSLDTESAYVTYGMVLARELDAEASIVARSGWGIYRDNGGSTANVLPAIFGNVLGTTAEPAYDFARKPDAVIVNLGTNDSATGDPGMPYQDAYVEFLGTLREKYPDAWVFLTIGPMTTDALLTSMRAHLDSVVSRFGDPKVASVPMEPQDAFTTGCDYHPDIGEHERMAGVLAAAMKPKLGW